MTTTKADSKRRVVLPEASPGDVFDIQRRGEGQFLLVRLAPPEPKAPMTRAECLRAIASHPLRMNLDWESLKAITREP